MRGREWQLQYKELQDICLGCGKYGHKELYCPLRKGKDSEATAVPQGRDEGTREHHATGSQTPSTGSPFVSWMFAQRNCCRPVQMTTGSFGSPIPANTTATNGGDQGGRPAVTRSRGMNSGTTGMGSRFSMLNGHEDAHMVEETVINGTETGSCAVNRSVTDIKEGGKGKEPMMWAAMDGVQPGPRVIVSHANFSDGLQGAWEVGLVASSKDGFNG